MREKGATFQNYMRAEMLKYKHTAVGKLTILMPLICIAMSAVLTHQYFAVDGYNWWYTGMYTGFLALVCGIISEKEKKMGNRAVYSLPCDMKKLWDAKVCYGLLISGGAMLLLTVGIIVVAFFLETQLQVHFILRPSLSEQLAASILLWLSFFWQIPWCLFLAQTIGRIPMLILHFVGTEIMTIILSLSPIYMFFPGAIGARMMCPLLKVMPNGLPAQTGEMTLHDIKTPLTIIKGNAELAKEDVGELKEVLSDQCEVSDQLSVLQGVENCQKQILEHTVEMEAYLDKMRLILKHQAAVETETCIDCDRLQERLKAQAEQMTSPQDLPLMVQCHHVQGVVQVNLEQLKRAWGNVLGNAMEYTDSEQGVDVCIHEVEKDGVSYLCAKVSDYGPGFSGEELNYAAEEFYRGDESRHDRSHQGLGLAIAKRFVEAQGGFLEIRNPEQTGGGEVSLWLKFVSDICIMKEENT